MRTLSNLSVVGVLCVSALVLSIPRDSGADGFPRACLCGDPDGSGERGAADIAQVRAKLAGLVAEVTAPEKCESIAGGGCGLLDFVVLQRALASLPPWVAPVCAAAQALSCPAEITCPAFPLAAPTSGVCEQTSAGGSALRLRGTVLAPKALLRAGEVLISAEGRITCMGCDCSGAPGGAGATVVTCAQGVVSPGLIDAEEHLTFFASPPHPFTSERYEHRHQWRLGLDGHTEISATGSITLDERRAAELRHLMAGTTAIVGHGSSAGLVRNLDSQANSGLDTRVDLDDFPLGDLAGERLDSGCGYPDLVRPVELGPWAYFPNLAEGTSLAAQNEFVCLSQALHDLFAVPGLRVAPRVLGIRAPHAAKLRAGGAIARWTPRSDSAIYGVTAPVTLLATSGVPLALATNSPVTGSTNLLRELRCADAQNATRFGERFSEYDLWQMVTTNAALATGTEPRIGTLRPGRVADLAVFDARLRSDYDAVLAADPQDVVLVMRGGVALYGDAPLLAEPGLGGATCEQVTVCGSPKRACVAREFGGAPTYTDLFTVADAAQSGGLFACDAPPSEPSCAMTRADYPSGPTLDDSDGDGVANAADLCASTFDPIRPLDGSGQADGDGDGLGDACDPCPTDATQNCVALAADDLDGDGVANGVDTCPTVANPTQLDIDADGVGDACDKTGCEVAADHPSNVGCEFWAVDLDQQDSFNDPASAPWSVALSNAGQAQANVTIEINGAAPGQPLALSVVAQVSVGGGTLITQPLPTRELDCGIVPNDYASPGTCLSSRAFRITSSEPIAVYQFNVAVNAFSNDASLLLPTSALGKLHRVVGWMAAHPIPFPQLGNIVDRSYVTVVGTEPDTQVTVKPSWRIKGNPPIAATMAGGEIVATLGPFDVLNLETDNATFSDDLTTATDLSGSLVQATKPVAVFSGVESASAPAGVVEVPTYPGWSEEQTCCLDHLEDQIFPMESMGTHYVVTRSPVRSTTGFREPDILRFVGVAEQAIVTTTLPPPFDSFTIAPGEVRTTWAQNDVIVTSDKPIAVGQLLVSNQYCEGVPIGDPSLTIFPSVEQFRTDYIILTPPSWSQNWVVIAAQQGTNVMLDGTETTGCVTELSGTLNGVTYESRRCALTEGVHVLSGDTPFGIIAYGYGSAASYAFAGGANVRPIYEPPPLE